MTPVMFDGESYYDDRLYLLYLCPCTVDTSGEHTISTTVYHQEPPIWHKWCLVTYRNTARFPAVRVDHFDTLNAARAYYQHVAPTVPLASLGGRSTTDPLSYEEFVIWERENGLKGYDYRPMYTGGSSPREIITTRK
jgi:hypothetical protein